MTAGKFPWTQATAHCNIYMSYVAGDQIEFQWPHWFSPELVALLTGMLTVDPGARWTVPQILQSDWCRHGMPMVCEDGAGMHEEEGKGPAAGAAEEAPPA